MKHGSGGDMIGAGFKSTIDFLDVKVQPVVSNMRVSETGQTQE